MIGGRLLRIGAGAAGLLGAAAVERLRGTPAEGSRLPRRLRITLERLGPTFVKFGQTLSLRRDLLPDTWLAELRRLQDHVAPFPGAEARHAVEVALGRPVEQVFAAFETEPMAAASIAQVHRARLPDGRAVIVKIRRPGIRVQIDRDMRALVGIGRVVLVFAPRLQRYQPLRIVDEIWANLRKETDFRQEARSIRRFGEAFRRWPALNIPDVIEDLYSEAVLVQEMSGGLGIGDPSVDGPRLAQVLVDAYLHQFFVVGFFHGDPHPGNLFVMPDGRLCFHDFGLVGYLDGRTRRSLALYLQAFVNKDAAWMLDAAVDLGLLGGPIDRPAFIRGIEEILSDYAVLPLKDWSLAEAVLRVARLGSGENFVVPHNLVVLMRALFLVESALRTLDPEFKVLDALLTRGGEMMEGVLRGGAAAAAFTRLRTEAALTAQDLPGLIAAWLHRAQREGAGPALVVRHEGLESLESHLDRTGNRLALAMVTLGLYVAASLLMLHSAGPRVFGDLPLLALLGYALALWLSFRLVRAVARSGRL
jgi:ubiquinone biosynthesis protein